jgi:hypothetical protein
MLYYRQFKQRLTVHALYVFYLKYGLLNLFKQLKMPPEYTRNHQSVGNKSTTLLTEPGINPPKVQASRFILRAYA